MGSDSGFTGPVNLGSEGEFTIRHLAETIVAMVGSSSKIEFRPLPQDDPKQRRPDIGLAREQLGWQPCVPLGSGLSNTIAYFRELLGQATPPRS
jgi:UDP-glucuronate decarboxylase